MARRSRKKKIIRAILYLLRDIFYAVVLVFLIMRVWQYRVEILDFATEKYEAIRGEEAPWVESGVRNYLIGLGDSEALPEIEEVPAVSVGKYAYSTLSEEEQLVYDQIYDAIINFKEEVDLSTLDKDVLGKVYNCVIADYGELFWVHGYTYHTYTVNEQITRLVFSPDFTMTQEEKDAYQAQVDAVVAQWLSGISLEATDYEKSKYVFEMLISNVDYVTDSPNNQNILSVFLGGQTVCQGYADAASYLFSELGIQSTVVTGTANDETHAWNLILLDGEYYYFDATWGNSKYLEQDQTTSKHINYVYLNANDDVILQDHTPKETFPIPACTSMANSYYVKENLYFETFNTNQVGSRIAELYNSGVMTVTLQFGNSMEFHRAIQSLLDDRNIRNYIRVESLSYVQLENYNVLTLMF